MSRFRRSGGILSIVAVLLQGCYQSLPLQQEVPPQGTRSVIVLNDNGRVALGPKLGPAVVSIEGALVGRDGESYRMKVFSVLQLGGTTSTWNGEEVVVAKEHTVGFQVRQVDKVKTALLAGAVIAGVTILFFGNKLLGSGADAPDTSGPGSQSLTGSLH